MQKKKKKVRLFKNCLENLNSNLSISPLSCNLRNNATSVKAQFDRQIFLNDESQLPFWHMQSKTQKKEKNNQTFFNSQKIKSLY